MVPGRPLDADAWDVLTNTSKSKGAGEAHGTGRILRAGTLDAQEGRVHTEVHSHLTAVDQFAKAVAPTDVVDAPEGERDEVPG